MKSPIKWAGGKSWLLDAVKELYLRSGQKRLVEPFCGSCAITFGIEPEAALLNDINFSLIAFYNEIKNGSYIDTGKFTLSKDEYYTIRDRFNVLKKQDERSLDLAEAFYYLNKAGFNGLYRENKKGCFNVPWGKRKKIAPIEVKTRDLCRYLFTCGEYQDIEIAPTDFLFVDPPYDTEFKNYSGAGFTFEDQDKLVWWLLEQNVPFVLTNQATDRIVEMYRDYELDLQFVEAPRRISCNGDRKPALEVIATNPRF